MAHDPTRHWPLGVGPNNTIVPGAAWLELLNGQVFPVVGAGAMVWNGTMWVPVSTQNRLPVDAAVSGSVDVSDRADRQLGKVTLSGSNLALRQTIVTGAKTVTSTAAEIFAGSSRLAGRHAMVIANVGTDHVYIGASGVTTNNGFPLFPGDTIRIDFNPSSSVPVFAVSGGPNVQVRVVELA